LDDLQLEHRLGNVSGRQSDSPAVGLDLLGQFLESFRSPSDGHHLGPLLAQLAGNLSTNPAGSPGYHRPTICDIPSRHAQESSVRLWGGAVPMLRHAVYPGIQRHGLASV